jgi:immune inhibitor A
MPASDLTARQPADSSDACFVVASPELNARVTADVQRLRGRARGPMSALLGVARTPRRLGFDDGVIVPPEEFPFGTSLARIRDAAAERAPLRGTVRVIAVLVDFSDKAMTTTADQVRDLFFSTGVLANGSVKEYYREVTNGLVDITGEVVGPLRMPQTLAWYANGNFGIGRPSGTTRARDLAHDAAVAADPGVNFGPYDNDGNGFVDAFIIVHAGRGGEETGNSGDIWSHKWVLPSVYNADATKIFGYLTIPEDAKIGVCAHELGHLLFGFPDLYDTDDTSEGIGNWCLMAGGSWNGNGDVPAHPSAWCKANQGWVSVNNLSANTNVSIPDVKVSHDVLRLWKDGAAGPEYFLVENRQRTGYDAQLPGDGLLVWHIDENQPGNTDENHYKVALVQADGKRDLELKRNRGDAGDPYQGTSNNTAFSHTTTPNSDSYAGQDTCVSITAISGSAATMTASITVRCGKGVAKDLKDGPKDFKEPWKDRKDLKGPFKDRKELKEPFKDRKEFKEPWKDRKELKEPFKDHKEFEQPPAGPAPSAADETAAALADLGSRVAAIEDLLGMGGGQPGGAEPFIGSELRPDLVGGPSYGPTPGQEDKMRAAEGGAKRAFDTGPQG